MFDVFGSSKGDSAEKSDAQEVAELKEMMYGQAAPADEQTPGPADDAAAAAPAAPPRSPPKGKGKARAGSPSARAGSPSKVTKSSSPEGGTTNHKHTTSSVSTASSVANRPKWNSKPLRNPPGNLRGVRPMTSEPWQDVAEDDLAARMEFGSRADLIAQGLVEEDKFFEHNGLVAEARERRRQNARARAWDSSTVKYQPPALRGQKTLRRTEPWSENHNDNIEELNAVDGSSINEIYAVTADRDNRVKSTIVQPEWDNTRNIGRPRLRPGGAEAQRAKSFRDARRAGTRAGAPAPVPQSRR